MPVSPTWSRISSCRPPVTCPFLLLSFYRYKSIEIFDPRAHVSMEEWFLILFCEPFFRIDPSAVEAQLPGVVDRLEAALAKLEQDGNDQDSWDQVSNSFQFLADSAREGTFLGH